MRSDADLVPLMRRAMEPAYPLPRYLAAHDVLVDVFGLEEAFGARRRVLVITGDALTERMAGPAIRAWNMADVLAAEHEVRLVNLSPSGAMVIFSLIPNIGEPISLMLNGRGRVSEKVLEREEIPRFL